MRKKLRVRSLGEEVEHLRKLRALGVESVENLEVRRYGNGRSENHESSGTGMMEILRVLGLETQKEKKCDNWNF